MSSLRKVNDGHEIRLIGMSDEPTSAILTGDFSTAMRTDLLGRKVGPREHVAGTLQLRLGAWEIVTLLLS